MPDNGLQSAEGTVIQFQAGETVREKGRVLVASGNQSRNRDRDTGLPYRLVPGGMRLDKWEKNPIIFYMHHFGVPLAKGKMFIEDGKLWAWDNFEFHRKEVPVFTFLGLEMFDTSAIADLWDEGFLNAVSIHIILSRLDEQNIIETEEEMVIPTSEVIETSVVTVPGDGDAAREQEFLEEFVDRLRGKGVSTDMAECVACNFSGLWTPPTPVLQSVQAANNGGLNSIKVPEVSMNKRKTEIAEIAEAAEETPVEDAAEVVTATLEVTDDVVIEQEIELPVEDLAMAIAEDPKALLILANALVSVPEFVQQLVAAAGAQVQTFEPVMQVAMPQKIRLTLTSSAAQGRQEMAQPVQPVQRPVVVQQAVAPVALPTEQANGQKRRKPSVLDLLPPRHN